MLGNAKIHKKEIAAVVAIIASVAALIWLYYFTFNPASSINFTIYVPSQKQTYSSHLVIPGYDRGSFVVFGLQRGVVGYAIQGDGTRVIEEKSSGDINCDGVRNCETRYTAKGQSYIYSSGDGSGQRVFMKKGNTKITIERSQGEAFSSSEWSDLIDAFEPIAADKLGYIFYFIDSKHVWRPV